MTVRTLRSGIVIGALMACFGLATIVASLSINSDPDGGWGARIFPLVGSSALLILGILELIKGISSQAPLPDDAKEPASLGRIFCLLLLALAYFWLIGKLGYLISTSLAAVVTLMIFGVRNPVGFAVAAVVCPAIYHLIFFVLLGVFPPYGEWFDLLDFLQGN